MHPADYPQGGTTNAAGQLLYDIEGANPLGARFVVGRQVAGGADTPLPQAALDEITKAATGSGPQSLARSYNDLGRVTVRKDTRQPIDLYLNERLTPVCG